MKLIIGVSLIIGVCCGKHRLYVLNTDCKHRLYVFNTDKHRLCVFNTDCTFFKWNEDPKRD